MVLNTPQPPSGDHPFGTTVQFIEHDVPLSQSMIWDKQLDYYQEKGVDAWDKIPFHITNSAYIGDHYAQLIYSVLLDLQDQLDFAAPLYILELGAGFGQFSFYCLAELLPKLKAHARLQALSVVYVASDVVEDNIRFIRNNPSLAPYIEAGQLDVALIDAQVQPPHIFLEHAQKTLSAEDFQNPLFLLANYLFDSLRNDKFRIINHQLEEIRYDTYYYTSPHTAHRPLTLSRMKQTAHYHPVQLPHYETPCFNHILEVFQQRLENASFMFPTATLSLLEQYSQLTNQRCILLTSDKGHNELEAFQRFDESDFAFHDEAVSVMVNFPAIEQYLQHKGGPVFLTRQKGISLKTMLGFFFEPKTNLDHTTSFFNYVLAKYNLVNHVMSAQWSFRPTAQNNPDIMYQAALGYINLANHYPGVFDYCIDILKAKTDLTPVQQRVQYEAIRQIETRLYPSGDRFVPYFWCALLYFNLQCYEDAIRVLDRLIEYFGPIGDATHLKAQALKATGAYRKAFFTYQYCVEGLPDSVPQKQSILQEMLEVKQLLLASDEPLSDEEMDKIFALEGP